MKMARSIANQEIDRRMVKLKQVEPEKQEALAKDPGLEASQGRPKKGRKQPVGTLELKKSTFRQSCASDSFTYNMSQEDLQE